jgi:hypothetical protein
MQRDIHELRAPISARSLIELCKSKKCPVGSSAVPSESQRAYCPRPFEISDQPVEAERWAFIQYTAHDAIDDDIRAPLDRR